MTCVTERTCAAPSRYIDETTRQLNRLAATFEDVQQSRLRAENRGDSFSSDALKVAESKISRALKKTLEAHVLYDWLPAGLSGARTGRILAAIGDPRRFPGQQCSNGHTLPPLYEAGTACPVEALERPAESEGFSEDSPGSAEIQPEYEKLNVRCPGVMSEPRPHTGVASLWHYFGLIPGADGSLVSRRKGQQASYSPQYRALVLGEMGVADQIVMRGIEPYRSKYDEFKSRRQADEQNGNENPCGLPPWRLHKIARIVASKAFLGDLLVEWKRRIG